MAKLKEGTPDAAAAAAAENHGEAEVTTELLGALESRLGITGIPGSVTESIEEQEPAAAEPEPEQPEDEPEDADDEDGEGDADAEPGEPEDADDEEDDEDDEPEDEDEEEKGKVEFSPEQQKVLDRRIGKEVGKRKRLEDELAEERQYREALAAEVEEMKQKMDGSEPAAAPAGVHPLFMLDDENQIAQREAKLRKFKRIADEEGWAIDGYEGSDPEKDPSIPAKEIRRRLAAVNEELMHYIPEARKLIRDRVEVDTEAREVYPNLFDKKHKDYLLFKRVLKTLPILNRYPNRSLIVGDMLAGEQLRMNKAEEAKGEKPKKLKKAPKMPRSSGGGGESVPQPKGKKRSAASAVDAKGYAESGGGHDALVNEAAKLVDGMG